MKFTKIVKKNLKLLIRAKSSALIVVFGPLIIILLVGLALNNPSTYDIALGYYSPDQNNALTQSFITQIEENNYIVILHETNESCIEAIRRSNAHTCIIFPEGFEIGNSAANTVVFYVDNSRANIAYQIIDSVSQQLEVRSTELSKDLTEVLLTKITQTKEDMDDSVVSIITIKSSIDSISSNIQGVKSQSEGLDFSLDVVSLNPIESEGDSLYGDAERLKNKGLDAVDEGRTLAAGNSTAELDELEEDIEDIFNGSYISHQNFKLLVENASDELDVLEDNLKESGEKNEEIISSLDTLTTSLNTLKTNVDSVKGKMESSKGNLQSIEISSAESIVSPINTEIKPVIAKTNQLILFFPFLLVLVIMFIGIMLSSALIIMEKNSKAAFRNFTTPTKEWYFVITTYVTSYIVLLAQVVIILGFSFYFLKADMLANVALASFVILISISTFVLIGMAIGYLTNTQESANMLSIALGSVFLMLSNLILPIETMSDFIKGLAQYNPYVITSELLKKTLLFNASFLESAQELSLLAIFMLAMVGIVFMINKLSRLKLTQKTPHLQHKGLIYLPEDSYLKLGQHVVKDKNDILLVLDSMTDEEFDKYVKKKNEIADWVSKTLQDKKLAWKLRYKPREKMIKALKTYLEKEWKKEEKKAQKEERKKQTT